jgi:hypothetical protein
MLELKAKQRKDKNLEGPSWTSKTFLLRNRVRTYSLIFLIIGVNILVIFMASFQKPNKDQSRNAIPGWLWPTVAFSIFGGGLLAWAALVLLQSDKYGKWLGVYAKIHEVAEDDSPWSTWQNNDDATLSIENTASSPAREDADLDARCKKTERELMIQKMLKEAEEDGTNRRLEETVSYTD